MRPDLPGTRGYRAPPVRFAHPTLTVSNGAGHADLAGAETRNGIPLAVPYVWNRHGQAHEADVEARLAAIDARRPRCISCGLRLSRCVCEVA